MGCSLGPFLTSAAVCFPSTIYTIELVEDVSSRVVSTNFENDHLYRHAAFPRSTNAGMSNANISVLAHVHARFTMAYNRDRHTRLSNTETTVTHTHARTHSDEE